jgi:hypothetical protein
VRGQRGDRTGPERPAPAHASRRPPPPKQQRRAVPPPADPRPAPHTAHSARPTAGRRRRRRLRLVFTELGCEEPILDELFGFCELLGAD